MSTRSVHQAPGERARLAALTTYTLSEAEAAVLDTISTQVCTVPAVGRKMDLESRARVERRLQAPLNQLPEGVYMPQGDQFAHCRLVGGVAVCLPPYSGKLSHFLRVRAVLQ